MRIMCVGDSNTAGVGNPPWPADGSGLDTGYWIGYRLKLKQLLESKGVSVDFVGSQSSGYKTFADSQHEGWPGDGIDKIQARVNSGMLETYAPDVVLLLIGANDMWRGLEQINRVPITDAQAQVVVGKLSALVTDMLVRRPGMLLLIGKPPTPSNCPQPLAIYRAGIDQIVTAKIAAGKYVNAIDFAGCENDGVHYSPAGHERIAERWYAAITSTAIVQPPAPAVPTTPVTPTTPTVTGAALGITNVAMTPSSGDTNTTFQFTCTYTNPANAPPVYAFLVVAKGSTRKWVAATPNGTAWTTGVVYTAQTTLDVGVYTYQFEFKTGTLVHWGNPAANVTITVTAAQPTGSLLKVSDNKRYLTKNGEPWLWLGDTGWTAVTSLSTGEMRTYLDRRKAQGYTVIQFIGAHWGAASPQLADGQPPFINNNPLTPNEPYWAKVDTFANLAAERGLVVAFAPIWNDFVNGTLHTVNTSNAQAFGQWLGSRYRNTTNMIFLLGGDLNPTGYEQIYNLMATGIKSVASNLISFHPGGGGTSAAAYFPTASWLDFSMIQSGHSLYNDDAKHVTVDYSKSPTRPVVQGEANYESCFPWPQTSGERIDDHEVRRTAYGAILSGACGYTYGANGVFQFYKGGPEYYQSRSVWTDAMEFPGALSMTHLQSLLKSFPWWKLAPASIVGEGAGINAARVIASKATDNSFALIYVPVYVEIVVNTAGLPSPLRARWYDPRTGIYEGDYIDSNSGSLRVMTPESMSDPDFVLVLTGT